MPKLCFTSDTHGKHDQIALPEADILIHCGDFTMGGSVAEITRFNTWLGEIGHKFKEILITPGNHDRLFATNAGLAKSLITNAKVLIDDWAVIDGLVIYMSPWTPAFMNWKFMLKSKGHAVNVWDGIPEEVDVLVTHGPMFGMHDLTDDHVHAGCRILRNRILNVRPKIHACGHIHEGYGITTWEDITFINASLCNSAYSPVNQPVEVNLLKNSCLVKKPS